MKIGDLYHGVISWKVNKSGMKYPLDLGMCLVVSFTNDGGCIILHNGKTLKMRNGDLLERINNE